MEAPLTPELALAILLASPSPPPDTLDSRGLASPEMVRRLTEECVREGQVRIVAGELVYLVRVGQLNAQGLGEFKPQGSSPAPPDPLAWPLVTRMDAVRTNRSLGMVLGALVGGAIGWAVDAPVLGASLGVSFGGGVGSLRVHEEPLYIARSVPPTRLAVDSAVTGSDTLPPSGNGAGPVAASTGTTGELSRERIRKATREIHSGSRLRVTLATMALAEGKVSRADDAGLHGLRPRQSRGAAPTQPDLIPWAQILRVEERVGSSGRGALRGGVLLGVLGGALGGAVVAGGGIGGGASNGGDAAAIAGGVTMGALIGGGIGAGLGALFGAAVLRWQVVY